MSNSDAETPAVCEQFYRRLLELHSRRDVEPLVADALKLIVEASAADVGYLELFADDEGPPKFWKSHGLTNQSLDVVRSHISRGVIGFAIAEGRSIRTASALRDDAFKDLGSVKHNAIEAVLCVPIGTRSQLVPGAWCRRARAARRGDGVARGEVLVRGAPDRCRRER